VTTGVEVRAVPLFAYDVNQGDELSVVASPEETLVATGVTKDNGNYTFRSWLPASATDSAAQEVVLMDYGRAFGARNNLFRKIYPFIAESQADRRLPGAGLMQALLRAVLGS
jgi:hypothetical protein